MTDLPGCALGARLPTFAVDRSAGLVYVSCPPHCRVHVLHAEDHRQLAIVGDASFVGPRGLAVDPTLRRVYVTRAHRSRRAAIEALTIIQRHATGRHTVDRTIPLRGVRPWHVAVDAAAGFVYVAGRGGHGSAPVLVLLDRLTLDELARVRLDGRPRGLRASGGVAHIELPSVGQTVDGTRLAMLGPSPSSAAGS